MSRTSLVRAATAIAAAFLLAASSCREGNAPVTADPAPTWTARVAEPREATAGRPPLLVLLHGIGADENDLFPLAAHLDPRVKVVSLRAPERYYAGYAWFHLDVHPGGQLVPDVAQARAALGDLDRWLAAAPDRYRTNPRGTFLLGFSQGAMMSLGVLCTNPGRVAGVIALSGRSPKGLFDCPADRAEVARVPLLVAHGTQDDVLPVDRGRAIRDEFQSLSTDFTYREFPIGHGISPDELALVGGWLAKHL
jgi:phospholipase/carboxylesterase